MLDRVERYSCQWEQRQKSEGVQLCGALRARQLGDERALRSDQLLGERWSFRLLWLAGRYRQSLEVGFQKRRWRPQTLRVA